MMEITVTREELYGVLLIISFVVTIMLTIITDEDQYIPQTTKNKEQLLDLERKSHPPKNMCLEYRLSQHSTRSEDVFRDNEVRLSINYEEWIQRLDYFESVNRASGRKSLNVSKN